MRILIKPTDIIERTLWSEFAYRVMSKYIGNKTVKEFIEQNEEFEMHENDALVIKLLRCVETENLSHRFNQHLEEQCNIKAFIDNKSDHDDYMVKESHLKSMIEDFRDQFPEEWEPDKVYAKALEDLMEYLKYWLEKWEEFERLEYTDKMGITHKCILYKHIEKAIQRKYL